MGTEAVSFMIWHISQNHPRQPDKRMEGFFSKFTKDALADYYF